MNISAAEKINDGKKPENKFQRLASLYADYARQAGIQMTAYRDESLPHFCALTDDLKAIALNSLEQNINIFEELVAQGLSLKDEK